ncbi:MAG: alpha/beta hydrolase [Acidobacteriia bacterium]|nr:alpha/beta hydrolase [Terriglobia bacterium]
MHPFYFGPQDMPLFGIYHPPLTRADRETGVVLCNTFGSEYIYSHRALRQLAVRLSRVGFHVLRFDYYGTGDSGGESDEVDLEQWKKDITIAISELKERAGLSKVSLIGLRLGAALGLLVSRERNDVESVLLWEPVIEGKGYIKELMNQHQGWLKEQLFSELKGPAPKKGVIEIVGFPLTDRMKQSIESIDLLSQDRCPVQHVLIVRSSREKDDQSLLSRLGGLGVSTVYKEIVASSQWLEREGLGQVVVPTEALEAMGQWMAEIHP